MKPSRLITACEMGALTVATAGELASQTDPTLPRPRMITGILVFYGFLGWLSAFGRGPARFAGASAAVVLLVTLVGTGVKGTGQGGNNLLRLFSASSNLLTGTPSQGGTA